MSGFQSHLKFLVSHQSWVEAGLDYKVFIVFPNICIAIVDVVFIFNMLFRIVFDVSLNNEFSSPWQKFMILVATQVQVLWDNDCCWGEIMSMHVWKFEINVDI